MVDFMYQTKYHTEKIEKLNFLVTGGAGFIGSNLVEYLLKYGAKKVRILDNFSTGFYKNIVQFEENKSFELIKGDIRDIETCKKAVAGIDIVFHQAALGSVPRSINDPITTNSVNISGFLNMLVASRDATIKRFVYAASSSTYGDSKELPKTEDRIGKPLSPYAITKYVNELYADIFTKTYGFDSIGLRYFNVFGPRQNPQGDYAAVIPKFIMQLINHESLVINGDGEYSRDFTFIENVVQANMLAAFVTKTDALNTVYNVAFGEQRTLNQLVKTTKRFLTIIDPDIEKVPVLYGPNRIGDIPHSLASIEKAMNFLGYKPYYSFELGIKSSIKWYLQEFSKA